MLAGFVAVVVLGLGFVFAWPQLVKVGAGAAAFVVGFYLFREAFKRRSGGSASGERPACSNAP